MIDPDGEALPTTSPQLPADGTFVVQFQQGPGGSVVAGRVEHLVTGQWTRFHGWPELEGFVGHLLRSGPAVR